MLHSRFAINEILPTKLTEDGKEVYDNEAVTAFRRFDEVLANYPGKLDPISARLVVRELYLELFGVAETTLKEGQIPEFLGFRQNPKESFRKLNSRANDMRRFKKLKVFKHFGYTFEQLSQKTRFEVEYIFSLCEEDEQRSPGVSLDLD